MSVQPATFLQTYGTLMDIRLKWWSRKISTLENLYLIFLYSDFQPLIHNKISNHLKKERLKNYYFLSRVKPSKECVTCDA